MRSVLATRIWDASPPAISPTRHRLYCSCLECWLPVSKRFGIGQSTDVPIAQRISTWVEVVPKLLAHLDIPHVALASHSAGTIYLLNTLYSCRQILSPTRPYAVLMAPFVDIRHSGVKLLQAAQLLPSTVLGCFDSVAKSLDTYVGPIIGSSLSFMDSWFPSAAEPESAAVARLLRWQSEYGMPNDFLDAILQAAVRAGMAESTKGLNDETRLCLKKSVTWGECEDFDEYVKKLAAREEQRAEGSRLRVKILFAQKDSMIGQRGRQYMEECWERNCRTETGQAFDVLAKTVDDTDHDGVPGRLTVLEEILGDLVGEVKVAEAEL
ncbi:hypothetical protein LMH87_001616 [Akanthomyces muscarius]|uniref:AB hydrolase-1 domain-containing protein n=1 Tax=Akanthomyces muscarius TaxID=2231603 RepID=A0A9W8Q613_AKAMU|nr:hypothetical protein LMH87_001616 [Akanthomyces muscarius]KAJ4147064.1 hypothetical protein LMH87_001616 [Akanthomyces muscarius]